MYINYLKYLLIGVIGGLCVYMIDVLIYLIVHNVSEMTYQETKLMMQKCNETAENRLFENRSIIDAGLWFGLPGSYLGILYNAKYQRGTNDEVHSTGFCKTLARIIILIPFAVAIMSPMLWMSSEWPRVVLCIFETSVPSFVLLFFMFSYYTVLC